jgi:uncharacterized protein YhdP
MIYRTARVLLEIVGVALGGLLVLSALLIWRLSTTSVEGSFLRPYIEQKINDSGLGFGVQLTDARIEWRRFRPVLDIRFSGVSVVGQNGQRVGAFQDGTLAFSVPDFLLGRPSLIEIDANRPEITIVRDKDDHFSLVVGVPNASQGAGNFSEALTRFMEPPSDGDGLGHLRRVRLVDGRITVDDRKLGITWSAPDVDLDLTRSQAQARAQIDLSIALPGHPARLLGEARYIRAERKAYLSLTVAGFDVAAAAPLASVLQPLSAFAVPVSGQVHAVLDGNGNLIGGDASLHGDAGDIVLPAYYPQPLHLSSLALDLHLTDAGKRLILDKIALDLGDAKFSAAGAAIFSGPDLSVDIDADVANIPLARFNDIWPEGFAVGGRDWVIGHIPEGTIKTGKVHLSGVGRTDDPSSVEIKSVAGAFDYVGLGVNYFPPLPPIRGIDGHGVFDGAHMDLTIETGSLLDIAISDGKIVLTGFDRDDRAIDIDLALDGPLKTALAVLDMKPLGYARDLGVIPKDVDGHLAMRANFNFPLIKSLEFKQVRLGAKGTLDGVGVKGVVGPRDVTDGALSMAVDKSGMRLTGNAKLSGVPLSLDWQESFKVSDPFRSRISLRADLDDSARAALGLVPPDGVALHGPIDVTAKVSITRSRDMTIDVEGDISRASFALDAFGLQKNAGDAGKASASLDFVDDVLRRAPLLKIESAGLTLDGAIDFDAAGAFRHAEVRHVVTPHEDFSLVANAEPGVAQSAPRYAVSLKGAIFDAAPILAQKGSAGPVSHTPVIDLTVALDHVLTGPKATLDALSGTATLSGGRLDAANLTAVAGGPVTLTYQPEGDSIALHFAADNAGAALSSLGLTRGVRGGVLRLDGATQVSDEPWLTKASLDLKQFRLIDAPIIARLVNAMSLTGFVDLLSGQGLGFDQLSAEMDYSDGKITFRNGRSAGALGISFEGDVDFDRDSIALKGTVVPVDTFNRIVAAIPVLGDILTGGNRGGFIGWTYAVSGAPDDPKVSVNPLSIFAPGFLRNLFFLGQPEPKPESSAPGNPSKDSSVAPGPASE